MVRSHLQQNKNQVAQSRSAARIAIAAGAGIALTAPAAMAFGAEALTGGGER